MVIVETEVPSATTGVLPEILEFAATTALGANTTLPPEKLPGVNKDKVFVSAVPEESVHVDNPLASEEEQVP
jgi:hypothetical protein